MLDSEIETLNILLKWTVVWNNTKVVMGVFQKFQRLIAELKNSYKVYGQKP